MPIGKVDQPKSGQARLKSSGHDAVQPAGSHGQIAENCIRQQYPKVFLDKLRIVSSLLNHSFFWL